MEIQQAIYYLNNKIYIYIIEVDDIYEYSFYNENLKVTNTGHINKDKLSLDEAFARICKEKCIGQDNVYKLTDEETKEVATRLDDDEWVSFL